MRAELVRVIGGPTGPALGLPGPTGMLGPAITGATGQLGSTGWQGLTGLAGAAGLVLGLIGPTGMLGPISSDGYMGPDGSQGPIGLLPGDDYFLLGQNSGFTGFPPTACCVGCKFIYPVKNLSGNGCLVYALFQGTYTDTNGALFSVGVVSNRVNAAAAPNAGEWGGYPGLFTQIQMPTPSGKPAYQTSFLCMEQLTFYTSSDYADGFFPANYWFDLAASCSSGTGGKISNVTAIIFEVPL